MNVRSEDVLERFEDQTAWPMLFLSLLFIVVIAIPALFAISAPVQSALAATDWTIWGIFVAEYIVRLTLARNKWLFFRRNLLDLAVIILPLLRPLRIFTSARGLRLLVAARLLAVAGRGYQAHRIINPQNIATAMMLFVLVIAGAALLELSAETAAPGANIKSFGDSLWWAIVTITTVGYGDRYPVTAAGRGVAVALMLIGVGLMGLLAASLTTWFLGEEKKAEGPDPTTSEILHRLDRIESSLRQLSEHAVSRSDLDG